MSSFPLVWGPASLGDIACDTRNGLLSFVSVEMSETLIQPYLFFGCRCEEAIDFYRQALGAQVEILMRYKDSPEPPSPGMLQPGCEDKVMHATLRIGVGWMVTVAGEPSP